MEQHRGSALDAAPQPALFQPGHLIDLEVSDFSQLSQNSPGWNLKFVQHGAGPLQCRLRVFHSPLVQFARVDLNLPFAAAGTIPQGAWSAAVIDGAPVRSRGVVLGPLEFCADDGRPLELFFEGPTRHLTLSAPRALVESFAFSLWRETLPRSDRFCFASHSHRSAFERQALYWLTLAHEKPELLRNPRFTTTMEFQFVETLLRGCVMTAPMEARAARHAAARRAHEHILGSLHQPLSIAEMCSRFSVGERALMQGFTEIYGMAPMTYHRQCRLDAVHAALRTGEGSVANVAMKWGFFHLGRFSQQYRRAFGYAPSRTPGIQAT